MRARRACSDYVKAPGRIRGRQTMGGLDFGVDAPLLGLSSAIQGATAGSMAGTTARAAARSDCRCCHLVVIRTCSRCGGRVERAWRSGGRDADRADHRSCPVRRHSRRQRTQLHRSRRHQPGRAGRGRALSTRWLRTSRWWYSGTLRRIDQEVNYWTLMAGDHGASATAAAAAHQALADTLTTTMR